MFALSPMVKKQPREVPLSACLVRALCSARGSITTAKTLHFKGIAKGEEGKRTVWVSQSPSKALSLLGVAAKILQKAQVGLGNFI